MPKTEEYKEPLPGPVLPTHEEVRRILEAIRQSARDIQSWDAHLMRQFDRGYNPQRAEDFEGVDWGFWQALVSLSRLVEHAQKVFALDMRTLKSPYMKKKERDQQ